MSDIYKYGLEPNLTHRPDDPLHLLHDPARYGSARQYQKLGDSAFRNEAYKEALDYYEQARLTFDLLGDVSRTANCHRDLGWTFLRLGDAPHARQHFSEAHEKYQSLNDTEGYLEILQDLGITERMSGHPDAAHKYFTTAMEACQEAHMYVKAGVSQVSILHDRPTNSAIIQL